MGYSRYGSSGCGLADRPQRSYNARRRIKLMAALPAGRGVFQDLAHLTAATEIHGMAFTKGGSLRGVEEMDQPLVMRQRMAHAERQVTGRAMAARGGIGASTRGYGRRHTDPNIMAMRKQAERDDAGGGSDGAVVIGGLMALLLWGVL